jgi:hypothetical protein
MSPLVGSGIGSRPPGNGMKPPPGPVFGIFFALVAMLPTWTAMSANTFANFAVL